MLASELIQLLQNTIVEEGDHEIVTREINWNTPNYIKKVTIPTKDDPKIVLRLFWQIKWEDIGI